MHHCLCAYFLDKTADELPYLKCPSNKVLSWCRGLWMWNVVFLFKCGCCKHTETDHRMWMCSTELMMLCKQSVQFNSIYRYSAKSHEKSCLMVLFKTLSLLASELFRILLFFSFFLRDRTSINSFDHLLNKAAFPSEATKMHLFSSIVVPSALYACEPWRATNKKFPVPHTAQCGL